MTELELIKLFEDTILDIYEQMGTADFSTLEGQQAALNEVVQQLEDLSIPLEDILPNLLFRSFKDGANIGDQRLGQILDNIEPPNRFRELEAISRLQRDTFEDLQAAIRTTIGSAEEVLASTRDIFAEGVARGAGRDQLNKQVANNFVRNGLVSFTTIDNKQLPLDFYSATVVRTKTRMARVEGMLERYLNNDVTIVQVSEHYPTCHKCAAMNGKVISLTGEHPGFLSVYDEGVELPIYHPNCRHTISPIQLDMLDQQTINKMQQDWRRFEPGKDPRTPAQKAAYKREQEIRAAANREKKQYARFQSVFGDDNYKTLGAFRRGKRYNTERFQELQSEYRSIMVRIGKGTL